ncbi:TetR/AcrR family transcriptional regulator [Mesorhizobium sp. LjNodule214]|uniref:TetR/AcrR family transcriptional regulator n=1 Tax=Mesorhizobium sp. LjNodule214 TaxID=3342252 RepID=UPI003ECEED18
MATPADNHLSVWTTEKLCSRIFERHRDHIKVQKQHLVVANLSRIVTAFLRLSNHKGFHATSLRDLAEGSGMSMGALYSYFDSKETLLVMVLEEVTATVVEVLDNAPQSVKSDPRMHLLWAIDTHIRLTETMLPWFVFAFMEAKSFPASARKAAVDSEVQTEDILAAIIERGVSEGAFQTTDPRFFAALVKPLLQDWYVKRAKYRKRGVEIGRYIAEVENLLLTSLGCPTSVLRSENDLVHQNRKASRMAEIKNAERGS